MYRITIEQTSGDPTVEAGKEYEKVYEQKFETMDLLQKIIILVNTKTRKRREKKEVKT